MPRGRASWAARLGRRSGRANTAGAGVSVGRSQAGRHGRRAGWQDPAGAVSGRAQIWALVVANLRFWGSVAPVARVELARWRATAGEIGDEEVRALALGKLDDEAFNAEVAATLATLAPRGVRTVVVQAIVALEVLFDYLDGRTEGLFDGPSCGAGHDGALSASGRAAGSGRDGAEYRGEPPYAGGHEPPDVEHMLEGGRRLSGSLRAVISGQAPSVSEPDGEYLKTLWRYAHERVSVLPGHEAIMPAALAAASRCAEAQLRLHAAAALGDEQLRRWAQSACEGSGLDWREYVGGSASSVLAMHALIATAARADVSEADAQAVDETYIAIGAMITTLDSLVDDARDRRVGEAGYIRVYEGRAEIQQRLLALVGEANLRAGQTPNGAHHAMTLAGVAAYYTTHAGAADPQNRAIRAAVRRRLTPAIWPALCVLAMWRAAKRARSALSGLTRQRGAVGRSAAGERHPGGG
jgi:tetraprenyl-beta-curcumene synthase